VPLLHFMVAVVIMPGGASSCCCDPMTNVTSWTPAQLTLVVTVTKTSVG
jgi:hypothetical protein